jgi:homoserine kinase
VQAVRLPLDVSLAFVVIVPDLTLSTARARQTLPNEVSRESAAFNLSRMALLIAGLADSRVLISEATEDRLHQDYRSPLFPAAPKLLSSMMAGGALAVCWSGAGPSLLGICLNTEAARVQASATEALAEADIHGQVLILHPDMHGLILNSEGTDDPYDFDGGE